MNILARLIICAGLLYPLGAQEQAPPKAREVVWIHESIPAAYFDQDDQQWIGYEVELLDMVFREIGIEPEYRRLPEVQIKNVGLGKDGARFMFGGLTKTPDRYEIFTISEATEHVRLRAAIHWDEGKEAGASFYGIFLAAFHGSQLIIAFPMLFAAIMVFRCLASATRRRYLFWGGMWVFVFASLITTMLASIVVTAFKTRTAEEIANIYGPEDLFRIKVAVKAHTPAVNHVAAYEAKTEGLRFDTLQGAISAVVAGQAVAVVHDEAMLHYEINKGAALKLVGEAFAPQEYGVFMRKEEDPHFVRRLNSAILKWRNDPEMQRRMQSYFQ